MIVRSQALAARDANCSLAPRIRQRFADWLRLNTFYEKLLPRKKLSAHLSVIVPCYNVGGYIDDFLLSLATQVVDPTSFEIIAVDDGSTDDTAQRLNYWTTLLPNIKYVRQKNQGLAAARNTGLDVATGEWVSFPDPDDFLSRDYLQCVDEELGRARTGALVMVVCNTKFYRESTGRVHDSHPLKCRFKDSRSVRSAVNMGEFMQLAANSAWLRRSCLSTLGLRFDLRIVPSFEDAHFINKLLLRAPEGEAVFLKRPVYYYRKRASEDSLIDRSKRDKRWYLDQLRYGVLDLLGDALAVQGEVPQFIERTALYECFWRFRHILNHPDELPLILSEHERIEFWELLLQIFDHIQASTIDDFELPVLSEEHRVGLLNVMKNAGPSVISVQVRGYDAETDLLQCSYVYRGAEPKPAFSVEGQEARTSDTSQRRVTFLGRPYFVEDSVCILMRGTESSLAAWVGERPCDIRIGNLSLGSSVTLREIVQFLDRPGVQ